MQQQFYKKDHLPKHDRQVLGFWKTRNSLYIEKLFLDKDQLKWKTVYGEVDVTKTLEYWCEFPNPYPIEEEKDNAKT